jgi:hypothetical protein
VNLRSTWTLFVAALGLMALIFFVERPMRKAVKEASEPLVFPGLNPAAVSKIQLHLRDQPDIQLVRAGGDWRLATPIAYPADSARLEKFLAALAALQWQTRLTALDLKDHTNYQAEFGFAAPFASLRVTDAGYERQLLVGSRAAVGDQVFVQVVGGDGCYLAPAALLGLFPPSYHEWRDRRVVNWSPKPGDRIKSRSAAGAFEIELGATNGLWSIVWPLPSRADNAKVAALLAGLDQSRVARFVSENPADLDSFGLQSPRLDIWFATGTNYRSGLVVGSSPTNAPGFTYVRRAESSSVFLVAKTNIEPWSVSLTDLRDRHIVDLASNEVSLVEFSAQDVCRVRRESNGQWNMLSPSQFRADPEIIELILSLLDHSEVVFEKAVVTDLAAYGLTAPAFRVALWRDPAARADSLIARVEFGAAKNDRVFVRRSDESAVNSISIEEAMRLPRISWQLRDRRMWNFPAADVLNITITQKGQKLRLVHGGTNDWAVAPGHQGIVNPYSVEEAVLRLGMLQAVYWVARGDDTADRFGIKETDHAVTLNVKRGTTFREFTIKFGRLSEYGNPFAMVELEGEPWYFEFPAPLYREFIESNFTIHAPPGRSR